MWLGFGNSIHVVSARASEDVRTYVPPALCLGTPVPRQKWVSEITGPGLLDGLTTSKAKLTTNILIALFFMPNLTDISDTGEMYKMRSEGY